MTARSLDLQTTKVLVTIREGVAWLALNNPERRNAVSLEMWRAMGDAAELIEADDEVRVVVIRGAGGKAFASGADISEFDEHRSNATQKNEYSRIAARGQQGFARSAKPLIAMIQGYCIGGGLAIALNADLRFATPASRFAIPAARLGVGYDFGGVAALARQVGPSRAKDILFSARQLDAEEALRIGLVDFVVDDATIEARVAAYAQLLAVNAPLSIRAAKAAVQQFERTSSGEGNAAISALIDACHNSQDYVEGRRAFLEKRTPAFKGR